MRSAQDRADLKTLKKACGKILADHAADGFINPFELATEVMEESVLTEEIQKLGLHLQLRQIFRALLRRAPDSKQPPLPHLPLVQEHYPSADGIGYVRFDLITRHDGLANVAQFRRKGGKLLEHANQLEAWLRERFGDNWAMEG